MLRAIRTAVQSQYGEAENAQTAVLRIEAASRDAPLAPAAWSGGTARRARSCCLRTIDCSLRRPCEKRAPTRVGGQMNHHMALMAASALLASVACGCAAETGSDEGAPAQEETGTAKSTQVITNPAGYNPPGYNPYNPALNPPGYNPPGMGYGVGVANPAGYNPPGYNPYNPALNPPGYNPPGMGGYGVANPPGYNPPGYNPAAPLANPPGYNPPGTF